LTSLSQATDASALFTDDPGFAQRLERRFAFAFAVDEEPSADQSPTLQQALLLMNGPITTRALNQAHVVERVVESADDRTALNSLFLRTLSRPVSDTEAHALLPTGEKLPAERKRIFQDIFWALLTSSEFATNH
jgi:hypothetical protein